MTAKVLLVEDSLELRDVVHLYLKLEGFDVVLAADGREGLYMVRAERPDLVITDINMPEIDGISFVKALRAQPEFKDIPVIAFTAYGSEERRAVIKAGADRVRTKPTDFESLFKDINELLAE
jgi:CheY-like chemotaxis protein